MDWSESHYLLAEPGDYIVVARKAKYGEDAGWPDSSADTAAATEDRPEWFIGGVTDENARDVEFSLDFLEPGVKYEATVYADAKDADYRTNAEAYAISKKKVTSRSMMKLHMAPGGGFAVSIKKM